MGETEIDDVRDQLVGQLLIGEVLTAGFGAAPPGAEMDFVDRHRRAALDGCASLAHPRLVGPAVVREVVDDGGRPRRLLAEKRERILLQGLEAAVLAEDLVLVELALGQARDEQLPDAAFGAKAHRVPPTVPGVEIADDADPRGIGRPDREADPGDAVKRHQARAELVVQAQMPAFGNEVDVHLAQQRRKAIGVVDLPLARRRGQTQAVGKRIAPALQRTGEQAGLVDPRQVSHWPAGRRVDNDDRRGFGDEGADDKMRHFRHACRDRKTGRRRFRQRCLRLSYPVFFA